jgi:hypothetical protein
MHVPIRNIVDLVRSIRTYGRARKDQDSIVIESDKEDQKNDLIEDQPVSSQSREFLTNFKSGKPAWHCSATATVNDLIETNLREELGLPQGTHTRLVTTNTSARLATFRSALPIAKQTPAVTNTQRGIYVGGLLQNSDENCISVVSSPRSTQLNIDIDDTAAMEANRDSPGGSSDDTPQPPSSGATTIPEQTFSPFELRSEHSSPSKLHSFDLQVRGGPSIAKNVI